MPKLTIPQRKALSIVPHITGFMSVAGSGFIITEIIRDRKKLSQIYHRLILGISSVDLISSGLGFALSTWPIPAGTEYVYGAVGNEATCRMQGFAISLSISGPLYNLALAIYYLQVIAYNRKERHLTVLERWMHFWSLSYGLAVATACLILNLYHSADLWCWIAAPPCNAENGDCPPDNARQHIRRWAFFGVPMWIAIFSITFIMCHVYRRVRQQETISRKWRRGTEDAAKCLTKQVATQATCYVLAFYMTWAFPTICRAIYAFGGVPPFALSLLSATFCPMQGFANFFIYTRPRYERFRRTHPDWSVASVLKKTFLKTCMFWKKDEADDMEDDMNPALKVGDFYTSSTFATGHHVNRSSVAVHLSSVFHKPEVAALTKETKIDIEAIDEK